MSDHVQVPPTLEALRARRFEILALAEQYRAFNVRVFGSVARGEATPESDIDLLVNFQEGGSLYDLSGLRLDLIELLGAQVDVISDHPGLRERFRQQVFQEAIPL